MIQTGLSSPSEMDNFDRQIGTAMSLTRSIETVAAVIAAMSGAMGHEVHPAVAPRLGAVAEAAMPGLGELDPGQRQTIVGILTSVFRQAADLIEHPERAPGWSFADPSILQATGKASMSVVGPLAQSMPSLEGLADRLAAGGSMCDVGTGVGWLAVAAARAWPHARIVGIDIFGPALDIAAGNLAQVGLAEHVELRHLDVRDLGKAEFDLVWFPGMFIDDVAAPEALIGARRSLLPGGWIVFGMYGGDQDEIGARLSDLRSVRSGGGAWTPDAAVRSLNDAGFAYVGELDRHWNAPLRLVAGRRV